MSRLNEVDRPVVGVISDLIDVDGADVNAARARYSEALRRTAFVIPVILPTELSFAEIDSLVAKKLSGLLLTGASSNVCPANYGQSIKFEKELLDSARDRLAFAAICAAERHGIPLLGICRGLQELNVAFGGTLYQDLAIREGAACHKEDTTRSRDEQYSPSHNVGVRAGGLLSHILNRGFEADIPVNSLHAQGIDDLGKGLVAEAVAPDGLIEAISLEVCAAPILAVQWHPEWFHATDPHSRALFGAFGMFCRESQISRANCTLRKERHVEWPARADS